MCADGVLRVTIRRNSQRAGLAFVNPAQMFGCANLTILTIGRRQAYIGDGFGDYNGKLSSLVRYPRRSRRRACRSGSGFRFRSRRAPR